MSTTEKPIELVQVEGWPRPKGYANGAISTGRTLHVAGQVGWTPAGVFERKDFAGQFDQALSNVVAVVRAAGATPDHIVHMRIYVTDLDAYRNGLAAVGTAWRTHLGRHFPAMALVGVAGLVEKDALVEIEAVAAMPETEPGAKP